MIRFFGVVGLAVAMVVVVGCAGYSWRSSVPQDMRTVSVPTFRNDSDIPELGAVATRQLLREFQREGTFDIRRVGDSALEIQGVVKNANAGISGYDRRSGLRISAYELVAGVEVSVIDKRSRKVLVNNRMYEARSTFAAAQDLATAKCDASGRLAEDLARQIVDDVLNLKW